eukprot:scaffold76541_cov41-Prasinocladus_malaysianus.AAC.1
MAPKKGDAKAAKAAEKARADAKKKAAEDKTFGLKNKNKSKVVRKYDPLPTSYVGVALWWP